MTLNQVVRSAIVAEQRLEKVKFCLESALDYKPHPTCPFPYHQEEAHHNICDCRTNWLLEAARLSGIEVA